MFQVLSSGRAIRGRRAYPAVLVFVVCLSLPAVAQAPFSIKTLLGSDQQKASTTPASPAAPAATPSPAAAAGPVAIPLPDVASRAEELKRLLRNITDQLPTQDQLDLTKAQLDERDEQLQTRLKEVDALLAGTPNTLELREEENFWRGQQKETADLRAQLLLWANVAQSAIQQLQAQQPIWNETLQQNQSTP